MKLMTGVRKLLKPIAAVPNRFYEKKTRSRLQNKEFSILCATCMGGVIYHRLGLQFLSPTINLWLQPKDFVKLCMDPDGYFSRELCFVDSEYKCPVAELGDIRIYFEHFQTNEEAAAKWNERKQRFLSDRIYIIAVAHKESEKDMYLKLIEQAKYRNIIVLSQFPWKHEKVLHIKPSRFGNNRVNYLDKDLFGFMKFEKTFDYVSFLNENC